MLPIFLFISRSRVRIRLSTFCVTDLLIYFQVESSKSTFCVTDLLIYFQVEGSKPSKYVFVLPIYLFFSRSRVRIRLSTFLVVRCSSLYLYPMDVYDFMKWETQCSQLRSAQKALSPCLHSDNSEEDIGIGLKTVSKWDSLNCLLICETEWRHWLIYNRKVIKLVHSFIVMSV